MKLILKHKFCLILPTFIILSLSISQNYIQGDSAGDATLSLEKSLVSLQIGEIKTVKIKALDSDGNVESFAVQSANHYSTVTALNDSYLRIKGNTLGLEEVTLTSESGIVNKITLRVFDPLILDDGKGLLIAFVDQFQKKWDDSGSGANQDGRFSHPIIPSDSKYDGFYALGSHAKNGYSDPNGNDYAVIVKDKNNAGLLAKPVDYESVWADSGSGASADGSFWRPIAPEGFVAFGLVAQSGYAKPSLDIIRCVAKQLTVQGKIGTSIWNDAGSGASADFGSFTIIEPDNKASADGSAFLPANTFTGAASHKTEDANLNVANLLDIDLPVMEAYDDVSEPKLTGYHTYESIHPLFSTSIFVPFTLIKDSDSAHTLKWKVANSPFYYVSRVEKYTSLDFFDNKQGSQDVTKKIVFETGYSTTDRDLFSTELGITISAESGVEFLGTGGKVSVSVTTTLKWETETAQTYSTSTTKSTEYIVPAGKCAELLQVTSSFLVITGNGFTMGELPMKSSGLKILEYPTTGANEKDDSSIIPGFMIIPALMSLTLVLIKTRKKYR